MTSNAAPRHARQPARALAGQHRRGAHRRRRRSAVRDRRHQDLRRSAAGTRRSPRSAASGCSSRKSRTRCSSGEIDLAVHSSKDMPAVLPDGLDDCRRAAARRPAATRSCCRSTTPRAQRRSSTVDELVAARADSPSIGTGSVRRIAQLTRLFPGARFTPIRGNLDTRLRKLDRRARCAGAGRRRTARLGFASRISLALPVDACVPAPGQGIVAIEIAAATSAVARRSCARSTIAAAARGARRRTRAGRRRSAAGARRRSARWRRRSTATARAGRGRSSRSTAAAVVARRGRGRARSDAARLGAALRRAIDRRRAPDEILAEVEAGSGADDRST